ncbi:MAG: hypothetical protein FWG32_02835 [Oscillospiraceae bacterium]|nr:hypothetical protein [Oscillospiraceae bacterium]
MLSVASLVLSGAVNTVARFTGMIALRVIAAVIVVSALYRMLSRNVAKRRAENYRFIEFIKKFRDGFSYLSEDRRQKANYKFFTCPDCKKKLRIPKGKGKVRITCARCGCRFSGRS